MFRAPAVRPGGGTCCFLCGSMLSWHFPTNTSIKKGVIASTLPQTFLQVNVFLHSIFLFVVLSKYAYQFPPYFMIYTKQGAAVLPFRFPVLSLFSGRPEKAGSPGLSANIRYGTSGYEKRKGGPYGPPSGNSSNFVLIRNPRSPASLPLLPPPPAKSAPAPPYPGQSRN